jgi:hypothetical protein
VSSGGLDNPKTVKRLRQVLYAACLLSLAAEVLVNDPSEPFPGFYALYGFTAFVVIVVAAKEGLRRLVMRREDYYDV